MTVSTPGGAGRRRAPRRSRGGRWLPGPATVHAALAAGAAGVLLGGLAAVGVAAGTALTAEPVSPSLPPALAPAPRAAAPAPRLGVPLAKGARAASTSSGLRAGRPAGSRGHPPGHGRDDATGSDPDH